MCTRLTGKAQLLKLFPVFDSKSQLIMRQALDPALLGRDLARVVVDTGAARVVAFSLQYMQTNFPHSLLPPATHPATMFDHQQGDCSTR